MMSWNDELAYDAEEWAIHLAADVGRISHSSLKFKNGSRYGENLYELKANGMGGCNMAVHAWYSEIGKYDFDHPGQTNIAGHFTQLVWDKTIQFGVGAAYKKSSGKTYIVARYSPPGNWVSGGSSYEDDVWKPKPGSHVPTEKELLLLGARDPTIVDVDVIGTNTGGKKDCIDVIDCSYYVKQGDCDIPLYKEYMKLSCYKSCSGCTPGDPVDGGWTHWAIVESCTVSCGEGYQISYRFCRNPPPKFGGKDCVGKRKILTPCNTLGCPDTNNNGNSNENTENPDGNFKPLGPFNPEVKPLKPVSNSTCIDDNKLCPDYHELGYCFSGIYTQWMYLNCKQSCDVCGKPFHGA